MRPEILIEIRVHFDSPAPDARMQQIELFTNVGPEYLDEILESYLMDQMMTGSRGTMIPRLIYTIKIGLFLATDTFETESNCGINTLTIGLVAACCEPGQRDRRGIVIQPLSARPKESL